MKIPLLIVLTLIFTMFMVSAQTSLGTFQLGSNVNLIQNCQASSYSNITRIVFPNSSIVLDGQYEMTKLGDNYNYSYIFDKLGHSFVYGHCDENGVDTNWQYDLEITTSGTTQSTAQGLGSIAFLVLMIALTGLFGWIGFKLTDSKSLWILGVFMLFLSVLFVVYDVWLGYEYQYNLTGANAIATSGIPETIFWVFLFLVIGGLLASLGLLFLRWKEVFRYLKGEITKKDDDEDLDDEMGLSKFEAT